MLTANSLQRDGTTVDFASQAQLALWTLDAAGTTATRQMLASGEFGMGHPAIVTAVAISPDGQTLFSGDDAGLGKLWNADTGTETHTLKGHTRSITAAVFLPEGRRLLTASQDGTVAQWDVASGRELPAMLTGAESTNTDAYDTPVTGLAISPDGRQAATLSEDAEDGVLLSAVRLWDTESGALVHQLYRGPDILTSVCYSNDGRSVLVAGTVAVAATDSASGSVVRRWDATTGQELTGAGGGAFLDLVERREAIWSAIEAPGGRAVLTVGGNGAMLWNPADTSRPELLFKPHGGVTTVDFSPDGRHAVTASSDRRAKIWNVATGRAELQLPAEHAAEITSAEFSPTDERVLLTASEDGTARLWNWADRRVVYVLEHAADGNCAARSNCRVFAGRHHRAHRRPRRADPTVEHPHGSDDGHLALRGRRAVRGVFRRWNPNPGRARQRPGTRLRRAHARTAGPLCRAHRRDRRGGFLARRNAGHHRQPRPVGQGLGSAHHQTTGR